MSFVSQFNAVGIDTSFQAFAPTCTDGYKIGHAGLYPEGTNFTYGNGTPRSDRLFLGSKSQGIGYDNKVVWAGIQGVLREVHGLWQRTFFGVPKEKAIKRYQRRMQAYLGDGEANAAYLSKLHDVGYLPVTVLSIDEGERLNMNVPGYVIFAFGEHFWITNYLETVMSSLLWKIVCNATIAYEYRRVFEKYAAATGVDPASVMIQGHDFSFRGMSGFVDAASCGFGHLISFAGTDTLPAIDYAEDMYGADVEKEFVACSVVATEHAVTTSNILYEAEQLRKHYPNASEAELREMGERAFIKRAITEVHPKGIISLVSDSFDFWSVLSKTAPSLAEEILSRQPDGLGLAKVVFRPDSGDPVEVLCGREVFTLQELLEFNASYHEDQLGVVARSEADGQLDITKIPLGARDQMRRAEVLVTHGGTFYRAFVKQGDVVPTGTTCEYGGYWLVPVANSPLTPEEKGAVEVLWETFNGTQTPLGYKVLHERVGLIYGDSITVARAEEILRRLKKKGFASNNVVFGIGSYTYQHNTRDTFGFAVKATACRVGDQFVELFKAPATEKDTLKKSAKGFLKVIKEDGDFKLLQEQDIDIDRLMEDSGELKPIYQNGVFLNPVTLAQIRQRLLG